MARYRGNSKYENLGLLGEGGQGAVFKVKRKSDCKILAMKQMNMTKMSQSNKEATENECKIQCSLNHQYIVKADSFEYDDDARKDFIFIYMEICDGRDLHEFIHSRAPTKNYLSEAEIWRLFAQLVDVLHYLHNLSEENKAIWDIVHRDLKPANMHCCVVIFLTSGHLEIRLGDFGMAIRIARNGTVTGDCGTPEYMAPQVINNMRYNQAADCYSLGVILYELCSLKFLFDEGGDETHVKAKINAGANAEIPIIYSSELRNLVKALVSIEPSKRPTAALLRGKPGVQWVLTQIKLDKSRRCHESTLQCLKVHKRNARAKDNEQSGRIHALEEQLRQMSQDAQAQLDSLSCRERKVDEREAMLDERSRCLAQTQELLEHREHTLREERIAFEQRRNQLAMLPLSHAPDPVSIGSNAMLSSHTSFTSSVSSISRELAVNEVVQAPDTLEFHLPQAVSLTPIRIAMRRRANTGDLRRRYVPAVQHQSTEDTLAVACSERKLPSQGDLHSALAASKKSRIPVSSARKLARTSYPEPSDKQELVFQHKNTNAIGQRKGVKNAPAAVQTTVHSAATHVYHTRSAAQAMKASAFRRL